VLLDWRENRNGRRRAREKNKLLTLFLTWLLNIGLIVKYKTILILKSKNLTCGLCSELIIKSKSFFVFLALYFIFLSHFNFFSRSLFYVVIPTSHMQCWVHSSSPTSGRWNIPYNNNNIAIYYFRFAGFYQWMHPGVNYI
jgi:hypothetical protein